MYVMICIDTGSHNFIRNPYRFFFRFLQDLIQDPVDPIGSYIRPYRFIQDLTQDPTGSYRICTRSYRILQDLMQVPKTYNTGPCIRSCQDPIRILSRISSSEGKLLINIVIIKENEPAF